MSNTQITGQITSPTDISAVQSQGNDFSFTDIDPVTFKAANDAVYEMRRSA